MGIVFVIYMINEILFPHFFCFFVYHYTLARPRLSFIYRSPARMRETTPFRPTRGSRVVRFSRVKQKYILSFVDLPFFSRSK
jgi:hypothetical protein